MQELDREQQGDLPGGDLLGVADEIQAGPVRRVGDDVGDLGGAAAEVLAVDEIGGLGPVRNSVCSSAYNLSSTHSTASSW